MKCTLSSVIFIGFILFTATGCAHTAVQNSHFDKFRDAFSASGLVPNLIPSFDPKAIMILRFEDGTNVRHPDSRIKTLSVHTPPVIELHPYDFGRLRDDQKFTLLIVSTNYSVRPSSLGVKLHLLGTNFALRRIESPEEIYNLVNETKFAVEYRAPDSTESRQYNVLLYDGVASSSPLQEVQDHKVDHNNFNVTHFTSNAGLSPSPYSGAIFGLSENAQNSANEASRAQGLAKSSIILVLSFINLFMFGN